MKQYLPFIILIIFSCSTSHKKDVDTIMIDYAQTTTYPLSDFIANYNIIRLEISDSILIGEISDIEFYNDDIILLDKKNNTILLFNQQGKLIHQLANSGRGAGEYIYLNDIAINSQGIFKIQKRILFPVLRF